MFAPGICLMTFYIIYEEYRPLSLKVHLNRKIVTSFILGSVFAVGSIPIMASGKSWMMSNMSGAVIPTFLAFYLWTKNRLNIPFTVLSVVLISFITYKLTAIIPDVGIAATFPEYLIPIGVAVVLSGVYAIWKGREMILPMSFTVTCLGTLIGADLVRLPELVYDLEFSGNIGGARTFDLVLVSPLLAFFLSFILLLVSSGFSRRRLLAGMRYVPDRSPVDDEWMAERFAEGYEELKWGRTRRAVLLSFSAVRAKIWYMGKVFSTHLTHDFRRNDLATALPHPLVRKDYEILKEFTNKSRPTGKEAYDAVITANLIMEYLDEQKKRKLASLGRRMVAYILDQAILLLLTGIILGIWISGMSFPLSEEPGVDVILIFFVFPLSIWASVQLPYYILFERFWRKTPGKRLLGLEVAEIGREKPTLEAVFARNIGRYFDMALLFYIIPLIIMAFSRNRQRVGDMVGDTIVMRMPPKSSSAYH